MPETSPKEKFKNQEKQKFADIALPVPLRKTFIYSIPENFANNVKIGSRLIVPFGGRHLTGYAVTLHETFPAELGIDITSVKEAVELVDEEPLLTEEIIALTKWTSDYYLSSWGEMLKATLPAGINTAIRQLVEITQSGIKELERSNNQNTVKSRVLNFVKEKNGVADREIKKKFGTSKAQRALRDLSKSGFIRITPKTEISKPKTQKAVRLKKRKQPSGEKTFTESQQKVLHALEQNRGEMLISDLMKKVSVSTSPLKTLEKKGFLQVFEKEIPRDPFTETELPEEEKLVLTGEQSQALKKIFEATNTNRYSTFLLHGVTGSGKTEVYIRAIKEVLRQGKSALMLVPEIALTPIFARRLRAIFGKETAILHSSLSKGERFDEWHRIFRGEANVVIGTRSAVFAPLENLGLIVVDEEHDTSYRQHEMPFYNARDVAVVRANFADAVVVLGSATPALESFHNAKAAKYKYLELTKRIAERPLADAKFIDMREAFKEEGKNPFLSSELINELRETAERKEQSIILLNRRGFSQFILCRKCGEAIHCKNCDIPLTYHKRDDRLICHYCNHREKTPEICPSCESSHLFFLGEGTQKIEKYLGEEFPELKIERIDRDTAKKRGALEKILDSFARGEIDILVGTQMVAKGHDFPNVTLVGVISVDKALSLPDFRAAERTFQLLTQVAGRAGRGDKKGKVLIQTFNPKHYALRHAKSQDYRAFYEEEIKFRKRYYFPPFVALAQVLVKHPNFKRAFDNIKIFRSALDEANSDKHCIVLGPAPAVLSRLKGEYRLQIIIKARTRRHLRETLDKALSIAEELSCDLKMLHLEIDPVNLL